MALQIIVILPWKFKEGTEVVSVSWNISDIELSMEDMVHIIYIYDAVKKLNLIMLGEDGVYDKEEGILGTLGRICDLVYNGASCKLWLIGEDEAGEMVELDAEKVLSIPRKIKSQEVVKRGFMSDFLFQNISNVFHAPQEVIDIIQNFTPIQEQKSKVDITPSTGKELSLDENGEVSLEDGYVIGKSAEIFGDKIFGTVPDCLHTAIDEISVENEEVAEEPIEKFKKLLHTQAVKSIVETAKEEYGSDMKVSDKNRIESKMKEDADRLVDKAYADYSITQKVIEKERQELLDELEDRERRLIEMRYFQDKTQVQTAQELEMSQVQVSRLEKKILLKMRKKITG